MSANVLDRTREFGAAISDLDPCHPHLDRDIWTAIAVLGSVLATEATATRASRPTVREALASYDEAVIQGERPMPATCLPSVRPLIAPRTGPIVMVALAIGGAVALTQQVRRHVSGRPASGRLLIRDADIYDALSRVLLGSLYGPIASDIAAMASSSALVLETPARRRLRRRRLASEASTYRRASRRPGRRDAQRHPPAACRAGSPPRARSRP